MGAGQGVCVGIPKAVSQAARTLRTGRGQRAPAGPPSLPPGLLPPPVLGSWAPPSAAVPWLPWLPSLPSCVHAPGASQIQHLVQRASVGVPQAEGACRHLGAPHPPGPTPPSCDPAQSSCICELSIKHCPALAQPSVPCPARAWGEVGGSGNPLQALPGDPGPQVLHPLPGQEGCSVTGSLLPAVHYRTEGLWGERHPRPEPLEDQAASMEGQVPPEHSCLHG